ncbi:MAG: tetratricopeptide repeat protein, partial [Boseongicola sp.]
MLSPILAAGKPDYANAVKLLSERKFELALKEFRAVIAVNPKHAESHFNIGRLLIAANRAPKAIMPLSTAATIQPRTGDHWQAWAEAVALGGNPEDEKKYLSALRAAPIDPNLRVELQDRFGSRRKKSRPSLAGMNAKMMRQLLDLVSKRDFANAAASASKALSAFPKSAVAANILAVAQANLGKDADAKSNYLRAINLDPRYAEAYDNYGRFLLSKNLPDEAVGYLRKAVILSPGMVSALVSLGSALNQMKDQRAAAAIPLERAVGSAPSNMRAHLELGNAYVRINDPEKAEEEYEIARVLANDDISPEHRVSLAQMQAKNGKEIEAMENFEKTLEQLPEFPAALSGKASLLQSLGKFDEAREFFRLASNFDPENGEYYRLYLTSHKTQPGDPIIDDILAVHANNNLSDTNRMNLD